MDRVSDPDVRLLGRGHDLGIVRRFMCAAAHSFFPPVAFSRILLILRGICVV